MLLSRVLTSESLVSSVDLLLEVLDGATSNNKSRINESNVTMKNKNAVVMTCGTGYRLTCGNTKATATMMRHNRTTAFKIIFVLIYECFISLPNKEIGNFCEKSWRYVLVLDGGLSRCRHALLLTCAFAS